MENSAYFAAGCFWGIEEAFSKVPGVLKTRVGYMGGAPDNPTYEQVCGGGTGHAETVKVVFDSEKVSYEKLLNLFWEIHDPTTLNRQGPDIGTQYRSAVFVTNEKEKEIAIKSLESHAGRFQGKITTEITQETKFFDAEEYHQQYFKKKS